MLLYYFGTFRSFLTYQYNHAKSSTSVQCVTSKKKKETLNTTQHYKIFFKNIKKKIKYKKNNQQQQNKTLYVSINRTVSLIIRIYSLSVIVMHITPSPQIRVTLKLTLPPPLSRPKNIHWIHQKQLPLSSSSSSHPYSPFFSLPFPSLQSKPKKTISNKISMFFWIIFLCTIFSLQYFSVWDLFYEDDFFLEIAGNRKLERTCSESSG